MSSTTTVLITGASGGIGKGLVAAYLRSPNTIVVAAVRKAASAQCLQSFTKASGSRIVVIEVDVASVDTIKRGIASLKSEPNIGSLDVVIANAAKASLTATSLGTKLTDLGASDIQPFIDVNVYGQLELYRAVAPLLRESKSRTRPKFVYISSAGGSLTGMQNVPGMSAYGASKALANFLFKWISIEQQDIIVWAQHPGLVFTESAKLAVEGLKPMGVDLTPLAISVEQSCQEILQVDSATLEKTHGKFLGPDGAELPW